MRVYRQQEEQLQKVKSYRLVLLFLLPLNPFRIVQQNCFYEIYTEC